MRRVRSMSDSEPIDVSGDAGPVDPGSYFYHGKTLYAVDRVTGSLSWWVDLPGPAMAVHIMSDGAVGEERFLMPSSSELGSETDMWGSRILVGEPRVLGACCMECLRLHRKRFECF